MGFNDDPIVDDNSKRSEESVNAARNMFTRKNGFILREEYPDYGVDLDIELVFENDRASSKKFAAQIKSTEKIKTRGEGNDLITLPFKTSRLGYLARRSPAYGIILIYDETSAKCYFDYVEDIIVRLDDMSSREDWRDQESVNILVPTTELTKDQLQNIHRKFSTRHENHNLMIKEHGSEFNIPHLELITHRSPGKINFQDPLQVADFLVKYGSFLFNENEYQSLSQMLGVLSRAVVDNSPELVFLSAILFTQMGNVVEADYYLRKARRLENNLSEEQIGIIGFSEIQLDFLKGNIDHKNFLKRLKELGTYAKSIENQLTLEINIVFFDLITNLENRDLIHNDLIKQRIGSLLHKIESVQIPEPKKHLLKIYHSENQHTFAINTYLNYYTRFKTKEGLQMPVPMAERIFYAQLTLELTSAAVETAFKAYHYANTNDLGLLKAYAAHHLAKYFFTFSSTMQIVKDEDNPAVNDIQKQIDRYENNQNFSLIAYNQFLELGMYQNAHEALCTAYEILNLCQRATGKNIGPRPAKNLLQIIAEIEYQHDLQPFESAVDRIFSDMARRQLGDKAPLKDATDQEIIYYAERILEGYDLPEDRLPSIIHDMKMHREFEKRCTNPNIQMLQDMRHMDDQRTFYRVPPNYVLWHKTLDIHTRPSIDIEVLLKEFETILTSD
ncbi:DUF4365 domain-containing protein [Daejeonella sp.]|uniref:DUF4365 domain-containing protein n=1 Tax=Daejeonella sp. TaxID=2805397 RepID=UPI0030C47853